MNKQKQTRRYRPQLSGYQRGGERRVCKIGKWGERWVVDAPKTIAGEHVVVYACQIIRLCTWNIGSVINQGHLHRKELYVLLHMIKWKVEDTTDLVGL